MGVSWCMLGDFRDLMGVNEFGMRRGEFGKLILRLVIQPWNILFSDILARTPIAFIRAGGKNQINLRKMHFSARGKNG